jgi:hypothetical protein
MWFRRLILTATGCRSVIKTPHANDERGGAGVLNETRATICRSRFRLALCIIMFFGERANNSDAAELVTIS